MDSTPPTDWMVDSGGTVPFGIITDQLPEPSTVADPTVEPDASLTVTVPSATPAPVSGISPDPSGVPADNPSTGGVPATNVVALGEDDGANPSDCVKELVALPHTGPVDTTGTLGLTTNAKRERVSSHGA